MKTDPATAYENFTRALADWWNTPGRCRVRKPELADFTGADGLDEGPDSERAARPKKIKPETRNQKP